MDNSGNRQDLTNFQMAMIWLIAILFSLFVLLFVPDVRTIIEVLVVIIVSIVIVIVGIFFVDNLFLLYNIGQWKGILCTSMVFLLVPAIMSVAYFLHLHDYMTSIPEDNRVAFCIVASVERTGGEGSVGHEWLYTHTINDTSFKSGEVVEVNVGKPFVLTSKITEYDGISDVGTMTSDDFIFENVDDYTEEIIIQNIVKVVERGGRKNSGAYAIFTVQYQLERVLPENFSFFDIYFFTSNNSEAFFLLIIMIMGIASVFYSFYIIHKGNKREEKIRAEMIAQKEREYEEAKKREKKIEERRFAEQERKFNSEKEAFIGSLNGKGFRDAAGVPQGIIYRGNRPIDNSNAVYGSFTVYLSKTGKCFHRSLGCCSAYKPTHYFDVVYCYKPCSLCVSSENNQGIPDWHKRYMTIQMKADRYGLKE